MADDPKSVNAFSLEYLKAVREQDDPATAMEGETAEPWEVREAGELYGFFHPWESLERGDTPPGVFRFRETALLFRLIWPALGRERRFRLGGKVNDEEDRADDAAQEDERLHPEVAPEGRHRRGSGLGSAG